MYQEIQKVVTYCQIYSWKMCLNILLLWRHIINELSKNILCWMGHQYTSLKGISLLSYETTVGIDGLLYNIYICEWWKDLINTFLNWNWNKNASIQTIDKQTEDFLMHWCSTNGSIRALSFAQFEWRVSQLVCLSLCLSFYKMLIASYIVVGMIIC